jgi:hypothetical protein
MTAFIYVVFFGVWIGFYWLYDFPAEMKGFAGTFAESFLPSKSLIASLITFAIVVLNSMIIAQMNNRFAIIRTRTFMPPFIYLLLSVCWLPAYGNYVAALGSMFVLLGLYLSLGMYKDKNVEIAFLSFFFLALSSFLIHEFVILTLIFWIGFAILNSFSGRVFFASVFGFLAPWILFFAIHYYFFNQTFFIPQVQEFVLNFSLFGVDALILFIYVIILIFVLVVSLFQITANSRQDSIQTRNILNFFKLLIISLSLLLIFRNSGFISYLPLVAIVFSLITSYIFTLLKNTFNYIVFLVLCLSSFLIAFYLIIF